MTELCRRHRTRRCAKCTAAAGKNDMNTAICTGKCRKSHPIKKMKRWRGALYCVTCHADTSTVQCSGCGRQRETQYVVRVAGRLLCSWCR